MTFTVSVCLFDKIPLLKLFLYPCSPVVYLRLNNAKYFLIKNIYSVAYAARPCVLCL